MLAVFDTSIFIGLETRRLCGRDVPPTGAISTMTVEELWLGALTAGDEAQERRHATFASATAHFDIIPVSREVAQLSAEIRAEGRSRGKRFTLADSSIGATARHLGLPVYAQDAGFEGMVGVEVHVV